MSALAPEFPGNTVLQWVTAAGLALAVGIALAVAMRLARVRLTALAARSAARLDAVIAALLRATGRWFIVVVAILAGAQALVLPERTSTLIARVFAFAVLLQAGLWLDAVVRALVGVKAEQRGTDAAAATSAVILGFITRVVLWSLVLLMVLDNFGVDVTALIASIGIGGIAVALAVQNILGDVFASLAIAFDKPVVIGDFIVVGTEHGTVERIGLKTTHLRSLSGELIVLPNSDLLSSRIRNYKRMFERRVILSFRVPYDTPLEKLSAIPDMVRTLVEREPLARFDRAHFSGFGTAALEYEAVYFVRDPHYNVYMDVQQRIAFGLIEMLREAGIDFHPAPPVRLAAVAGEAR